MFHKNLSISLSAGKMTDLLLPRVAASFVLISSTSCPSVVGYCTKMLVTYAGMFTGISVASLAFKAKFSINRLSSVQFLSV